MLTVKKRKFNDFVIKEAGLELDEDNHVIDQDTFMPIMVKDKYVKYNNGAIVRLNSDEIEFDPLDNLLLARTICDNHVAKIQEEGIMDVYAYGITNKYKDNTGNAVIRTAENGDIATDTYNLDTLKYISIITTLNGTDTNSKDTIKLKSYDIKTPKTPTTRKRRK